MRRRSLTLLALSCACASRQPDAGAPAGAAPSRDAATTPLHLPSDAAAQRSSSGASEMISSLQDLLVTLSRELSFDEIVARLGTLTEDPGPPLPARLASADPAFRQISVARDPDTGKPYTVDLVLAAPLAVTSLAEAFGAYRQARTDRGRPRQLLFAPTGPGPWKIVIIAEIPSGASPLDEAETTRLILRRDPP